MNHTNMRRVLKQPTLRMLDGGELHMQLGGENTIGAAGTTILTPIPGVGAWQGGMMSRRMQRPVAAPAVQGFSHIRSQQAPSQPGMVSYGPEVSTTAAPAVSPLPATGAGAGRGSAIPTPPINPLASGPGYKVSPTTNALGMPSVRDAMKGPVGTPSTTPASAAAPTGFTEMKNNPGVYSNAAGNSFGNTPGLAAAPTGGLRNGGTPGNPSAAMHAAADSLIQNHYRPMQAPQDNSPFQGMTGNNYQGSNAPVIPGGLQRQIEADQLKPSAGLGLRHGGPSYEDGKGGQVPGPAKGDTHDAKYEGGEFVVSNAMLEAKPELRGYLRELREEVLAEKGMTPAEADAKALRGNTVRAINGLPDEWLNGPWNKATQGAAASRVPFTLPTEGASNVLNGAAKIGEFTPEVAQAAQQATGKMYRAGNLAGKATRILGPAAAGADVVSHFNDYKIDDPSVDSSAMGTLRAVRDGDWSGAGRSLSKGALEAGMDLGSFAANTADYFVPGKAPVSTAYHNMLRDNFGDQLKVADGAGGAKVVKPAVAAAKPVAAAAEARPLDTNPGDTPAVMAARKAERDAQTQRDWALADRMEADRLRQGPSFSVIGDGYGYGLLSKEHQDKRNAEFANRLPTISDLRGQGLSARSAAAHLAQMQATQAQREGHRLSAEAQRYSADTQRYGTDVNAGVSLRNTADTNATHLAGNKMTNQMAMNSALRDQANKNREFDMKTQEFRAGRTDKANERARQGREDFYKHATESFQTVVDGKPAPDLATANQYTQFVQQYLNQPGMKEKYPGGIGDVDDADRAALMNLFKIKQIQDKTHSAISPFGSSGTTSLRPQDYVPTGRKDGLLQNTITNANGAVPEDALRYGANYNPVLPNWRAADTTLLPR